MRRVLELATVAVLAAVAATAISTAVAQDDEFPVQDLVVESEIVSSSGRAVDLDQLFRSAIFPIAADADPDTPGVQCPAGMEEHTALRGRYVIHRTPTATFGANLGTAYTNTSGTVRRGGTAQTLSISGAPSLTGQLALTGAPSISGSPSISGAPGITGSLRLSGSPSISGAPGIGGTLSISGSPSISGAPSYTEPSGSAILSAAAVSGRNDAAVTGTITQPDHSHTVSDSAVELGGTPRFLPSGTTFGTSSNSRTTSSVGPSISHSLVAANHSHTIAGHTHPLSISGGSVGIGSLSVGPGTLAVSGSLTPTIGDLAVGPGTLAVSGSLTPTIGDLAVGPGTLAAGLGTLAVTGALTPGSGNLSISSVTAQDPPAPARAYIYCEVSDA